MENYVGFTMTNLQVINLIVCILLIINLLILFLLNKKLIKRNGEVEELTNWGNSLQLDNDRLVSKSENLECDLSNLNRTFRIKEEYVKSLVQDKGVLSEELNESLKEKSYLKEKVEMLTAKFKEDDIAPQIKQVKKPAPKKKPNKDNSKPS